MIAGFSPDLLKQIEIYGTQKTVAAGQIIFSGHMTLSALPVILKGTVRICRQDENGREIFLYYVKENESCIASLFKSLHVQPLKIKATTEEDSEILYIPLFKATEWMKMYPEWAEFIFILYRKRFDDLLEAIHDISFQKTDERILGLLIKKASAKRKIELPITHQQIADELGTTREVISRSLKQMATQKMVSLARNKVTLLVAL